MVRGSRHAGLSALTRRAWWWWGGGAAQARHAVACFLTRGDLWQSWEAGARVFDRYLLDADWALNNGNWMWLSASAFFHQYFRVYGPVRARYPSPPDLRNHLERVLEARGQIAGVLALVRLRIRVNDVLQADDREVVKPPHRCSCLRKTTYITSCWCESEVGLRIYEKDHTQTAYPSSSSAVGFCYEAGC
jgi:hypothetical protein